MWAIEMSLNAGADMPQYCECFGVGPGENTDGGIDVVEVVEWHSLAFHRFSMHTLAGWRSTLLVARGSSVSRSSV